MVKKSIAIIGEGETEWFYFERLRTHKRYSFRLRRKGATPVVEEAQYMGVMCGKC